MNRRHLLVSLGTLLAALAVVAAAAILFRHRAAPPAPPAAKAPAVAPAPVPALGLITVPPPPAAPEKLLRPQLLEALGFGAASPWNRRLDLIRGLPADLTAVETDTLLAALMESCPTTLYPAVHSTYMHEIACILQPRDGVRGRFAQALATLARDPRRDDSTRDYAIQHLRQVWSRAGGDPALRDSVVATFRELTTLDPVVATPALLSLHLLGSPSEDVSLHGGQPAADRAAPIAARSGNPLPSYHIPDSELIPLLQPVFAATTSAASIPARLTAARIAGERRMTAFRAPLLAAVKDPSEHALVRMAAANALGKIADPADLKTLATLDPGDARVAAALRHAVQRQAAR